MGTEGDASGEEYFAGFPETDGDSTHPVPPTEGDASGEFQEHPETVDGESTHPVPKTEGDASGEEYFAGFPETDGDSTHPVPPTEGDASGEFHEHPETVDGESTKPEKPETD